jgi:hypothetical protein
MNLYEQEKKGIQWSNDKTKPNENLTALKNFKWKMKPQVSDIMKSEANKFDPKRSKYFNQILDK